MEESKEFNSANEIINAVYSQTGDSRQLDTNLIVNHNMNPKYLAEDSKLIVDGQGSDMKESYGSYTTQQLLYMSSSYIAGYSLDVPPYFEAPDNPQKYSSFNRWSYSFNDYCKMADIVVDYMNEHGIYIRSDSVNDPDDTNWWRIDAEQWIVCPVIVDQWVNEKIIIDCLPFEELWY